jgi:hypothetical protein
MRSAETGQIPVSQNNNSDKSLRSDDSLLSIFD